MHLSNTPRASVGSGGTCIHTWCIHTSGGTWTGSGLGSGLGPGRLGGNLDTAGGSAKASLASWGA